MSNTLADPSILTEAVDPVSAASVADVVPIADAAPPAETPPVLHTDAPSLLEQAMQPPEPPKPAEDAKPVEPEPIKYEPFKLPEGTVADEPTLEKYTEILGKHRIPQEAAQDLLDLYGSHITAAAQGMQVKLQETQHQAFSQMREGWANQIKSDPIMGGSGFETTQAAVARMAQRFVPSEDIPAFNELLRVTGAGDHPAFWRMLNNVAKVFDEPHMAPVPNNPPRDRGNPRGSGSIYDHPSSPRRGG